MSALAAPRSVARRAYGRPSRMRSAEQRQADRRDLADRRRARGRSSRGWQKATSPADSASHLDECVRQPPLVDQVEDAVVLAERRPEAGRAAWVRRPRATGRPGRASPRRPGSRIPAAASADARWSAWAAPATVAAVWTSSPANWRKNRRRPRSTGGGLAGRRRAACRPGRRSGRRPRVAARIAPISVLRPCAAQYLMTLVTCVRRAGRGP